ncbi:hypothetical protein F5Y14DRAFT_381065 [Nemania sp. NC0429]|nr:hypothetical protein F5Y14DRAFT_381065 [Nemania sp. NC0429]
MSEEDEKASRPSRYRSLRKQASSATAPPSTQRVAGGTRHESDQQHENAAANSVSRSMSRYRRRAASVAGDKDHEVAPTMASKPNNTPPVPAIPLSLKPPDSFATTGSQTAPVLDSSSAGRPSRRAEMPRKVTSQTTGDGDSHSSMTHDSNRSRPVITGQNAQHVPLEQLDASRAAERDRLLAEQKRKDLQRLEEELENSQKSKAQSHKIRTPVVEKFVLLAKGSKSNNKEAVAPAPAPASAPPPIIPAMPPRSSTRRSDQESAKTHIEPGGKGIVPQKDAPASAVNAGDRNVKVLCRHYTLSLPVTPETTTIDIIADTSRIMAWELKMKSEECLVTELHSILGLERRLRRYEYIRDVMNSWDTDTQNHLTVSMRDPNDNHQDLDVSAVVDSKNAPSGCRVYIYHSNRPGKWNKRWIALLESGQIISAKKPDAKASDKDTASLCHLSDYDIYTPTESQMRKHIKPPKRFCFAIKSQHKTTMFLNTENYVQYFSTDDPQAAREFKQKVHDWRSWYLVDRRPEIRTKQPGSAARTEEISLPQSPPTKHVPKKAGSMASADGHRLRVSVDESPYAIGQFEPLLDMKRFDKRLSQFGIDFIPPATDPPTGQATDLNVRRRLSKREKPNHRPPQSSTQDSSEGFTGGLLGEEYDNRKKILDSSDRRKRPQELTLNEGPPLGNNQQDTESWTETPVSPSWFPSAQEHTAKQRAAPQTTPTRSTTSVEPGNERRISPKTATPHSTGLVSSAARPSTQHTSRAHNTQHNTHPLGSKPSDLPHSDRRINNRPLVDLAPANHEAPQRWQDRKGHGVKPPEGLGRLVDFISASNGTDGKSSSHLGSPPQSTARRPTTSGDVSLGRSRSMSSASAPKRRLLEDIPPVPLLPSQLGHGSDGGHGNRLASAPIARDGRVHRRETVKHGEKEQEKARLRERERQQQRDREYREREAAYNAVPGRTGTLKAV